MGTEAREYRHPDDRPDVVDRWSSNGCVVLNHYEHPIEVTDHPGIWSEDRRHAGRAEGTGIVAMYAARTGRRDIRFQGYDRALATSARRTHGVALITSPMPLGRVTSNHYRTLRQVRSAARRERMAGAQSGGTLGMETRSDGSWWQRPFSWMHGMGVGPRQAAVAGLAALALLVGMIGTTFAEQYRYEVQQGDTIESIADTFGVDPDAIRQASYLPNGDQLVAGQAIVIPSVGQSPDDAAQEAAQLEGTSPWAMTAHYMQSGETLSDVAAAYGLTAEALISFNGISDVYDIQVGQRIVIPPSRTSTGTITATATGTGTATMTPVAGGKVTGTGGAGLNCRRTPSSSGVVITTLPEGSTIVYRGAASNGWQPVTCAGQAGYISTSYVTNVTITPTPSGTPTRTPSTTTTPASGNTGMVTGTGGGGLNCRQQANAGAPIITILPEGSIVQFTGPASNGWQPVVCAGQAGFISTTYLTAIATGTGELWVDVNLSTQYMRVYRGSTVILGTYVSTGRPGFDTPTGTWRVNTKLPSQTMSGVIGGEYYNVPNVPWVMYFTNWGHAIHGAYWHNNFGHVMSHGCVNLPVSTAAWLYAQAPIGMRVVIHY